MYETYKKEHPNRNIELVKGMLRPAFCNRPARFKDEKFIVKYLAYTVLLKGLQYLIQAWREIDLKDSILEIGGPIEDSVFKLIKHDLDSTQNIVFSGTVTDKEAFFSNASLFVLPSIIDGAPVVVLEAMMAGVPVIITENCGNKDFVSEGYTGFIIPIADVDSLKTKIKYCYEHRNKLSEMGERCHKIISEFDTNEFTRDLLDHINKGEENIH
jgi:glycosyltransferase involved in cell wall biosynthesis